MRKLQIGAGGNTLPGWLNTDVAPGPGVAYLDGTRPFPLGDETFDYVFSEHQLEHVELAQGHAMLGECFRIMRPGGVIRIATPSLERIVALTAPDLSDLQRHYIEEVTDLCVPDARLRSGAVLVNNMFRNWGHRFIYDRSTLRAVLEDVGFIDVTFHDVGESSDVILRGIEQHGRALGDDRLNRVETMVAEARKPRVNEALANVPFRQ